MTNRLSLGPDERGAASLAVTLFVVYLAVSASIVAAASLVVGSTHATEADFDAGQTVGAETERGGTYGYVGHDDYGEFHPSAVELFPYREGVGETTAGLYNYSQTLYGSTSWTNDAGQPAVRYGSPGDTFGFVNGFHTSFNDTSNSGSIVATFNFSNATDNSAVIIVGQNTKDTATGTESGGNRWRLGYRLDSNLLQFTVYQGTNFGTEIDLEPNVTHTVAVTWNASGRYLFANGELVASDGVSVLNDASSGYDLYLSKTAWHTTRGYSTAPVTISELRFYSEPLATSQVKRFASNPTARFGITSRWAFDAGEGSAAFDHVADHDGTLKNGTSWTSDAVSGQALSFAENKNYVDIDSVKFTGGSYTFSAWVNLSSATDAWLYDFNDGSGDGRVAVQINDSGGNGIGLYAGGWYEPGVDVLTDGWHHVAVVTDGSTAWFYVDGDLKATTSAGNVAYDGTGEAAIGSRFDGATNHGFDGSVDEARIYSSALSPGQVHRLFERETVKLSAQTSERWAFDAGGVPVGSHSMKFATDGSSIDEIAFRTRDGTAQVHLDNIKMNGSLVDGFEDGSLSEWSDTTHFEVNSTHAFGDYSLYGAAYSEITGESTSRSMAANAYSSVSFSARWNNFKTFTDILLSGNGTKLIYLGADDGGKVSDAGSLIYYNGSSWVDTGIQIQQEAWYRFEIKNIDYSAETYDLRVTQIEGGTAYGDTRADAMLRGNSKWVKSGFGGYAVETENENPAGSGSGVDVDALDMTGGTYTVVTTVNITESDGAGYIIDTNDADTGRFIAGFGQGSASDWELAVYNGSVWKPLGVQITPNKTQTVAYRFNATSDTAVGFVNGTAGSQVSFTDSQEFGDAVSIGAAYGGTPTTGGVFHDFRIYQLALTDSALTWLTNHPTAQLNETSVYRSLNHTAENTEQGFTNLTLSNAQAVVTWKGVYANGSQTTLSSATYNTTGNHTQTWSAFSGANVQVVVDFENTAPAYTAQLDAEGVQYPNSPPTVNNSTAEPSGGTKVSSSTFTLAINASDPDVTTPQDNITVHFYNASNDALIGSDTLEDANGTANTTWTLSEGGTYTWYAVAEDAHGAQSTSQANAKRFDLQLPATVYIYNETNTSQLVKGPNITVKGRFYSGELVFEKQSSDGTIDFTGLPADREYIMTLNVEGYHRRTVIIDSLFEQESIYLLSKNEKSVEVRFTLSDKTGDFEGNEPEVLLEKPINESGSHSWKVIAGDRLGVEGYTVDLQEDQRYRIILRNNDGDQRVLGKFTAVTAETIELQVGQLNINPVGNTSAYRWNASRSNATGTPTIKFRFNDTERETTNLRVVIYERNNPSNELFNETYAGPYGTFTVDQPLTAAQANKTWVVAWDADRDGDRIDGQRAVGPTHDEQVEDFADIYQWAISIGSILILGGLFSKANAGVGAVVMALVGSIWWFIGWLPPELGAGAVFLALAVAALFAVRGQGGPY